MSIGPSRARDDNTSWDNRVLSVMDWCIDREFPFVKKVTLQLVRHHYKHVGMVVNLFPWGTTKKAHFYLEFSNPNEAIAANNLPPPASYILKFLIKQDRQHRKRFMDLASSNNRYSPYDRAQRQHPNGTNGSHSLGERNPYSDWPGSSSDPYGGDTTMVEPEPEPEPGEIVASAAPSPSDTLTVPIMGEKVRMPANDPATPAALSALMAATSMNSPSINVPSPRESTSSGQTAEEILATLSDLRNQKAYNAGGRPPDTVNTRHRIHPNFDFEHHVMSGRFLRSTTSNNDKELQNFKLSPLQSYFASIYGSLQSELHDTKTKQRQKLLEVEEQRAVNRRLADELGEERTARRTAEKKVAELQRQLEQARAKAVEQTSAMRDYRMERKEAREQADILQRSLKEIKRECERALSQTAVSPGSSGSG